MSLNYTFGCVSLSIEKKIILILFLLSLVLTGLSDFYFQKVTRTLQIWHDYRNNLVAVFAVDSEIAI
jgi:hypothetical protein